MSQPIERPFPVAVQQVAFGEVRREEERAAIAFGRVNNPVETLVPLAIVVDHRFDAQLVDNRTRASGEVVEAGGFRIHAHCRGCKRIGFVQLVGVYGIN